MPATSRRVLVAVLLIAAVASSWTGVGAGAQRVGAPEHILEMAGTSVYESPTFGYVVAWDPAEAPWRVVTDDSAGENDRLVLTSDAGEVTFDGYEGDGGDPRACLARSARQARRLEGVSGFRKADFGDWQGENPVRSASETRAIDVYTLRYTDAQGSDSDLALQLDCRVLVPGSAVLLVTYVTTIERYNDGTLFFWADDLMGGVALPRQSFERDASGQLAAHDAYKHAAYNQEWAQVPQLMLDAAGDELGMATFLGNSLGLPFFQVLIENTGDRRLDPRHLPFAAAPSSAEAGSPTVAPASVTVVGLPSASRTDAALRPGDRAVVRLEFAPPLDWAGCGMWDLLYAPEDGNLTTIGTLGGCSGGGLRPRITTG